MSNSVGKFRLDNQVELDNREEEAWGKANDRRGTAYAGNGVSYRDYAVAFAREFPIGTILTHQQFDEWLQRCGLLTIPPSDASKGSDAWMGHLQRRFQHRDKINKAATHPRMWERGSTPFVIAAYAGGYEVQAPHTAATRSHIGDSIMSLLETKKKQIAYLMQSSDWTQLPPYERVMAQEIYEDLSEYSEDMKTGADRHNKKVTRLQTRLRASIERGEIQSVDGSLKRLVEHQSGDDESQT